MGEIRIVIENGLHKALRIEAATNNKTLRELIVEALKEKVKRVN